MVFVFYKVAALVLKVFSKPFIQKTKMFQLSVNAKNMNWRSRAFFIRLGNNFNYYQQLINQKFLQITTSNAYKPLNEQLAIEKGINFFYEIIFYLIIISVPIYQMNRASKQSKYKAKIQQENIKNLETRLSVLNKQIIQKRQQIQKAKIKYHPFVNTQGKQTNNSLNKICIKMLDKKVHMYYLDSLA